MRYIIIVTILLILAGCEEIERLQGLGQGDVGVSTDTYEVPVDTGTSRIPIPVLPIERR